MSAGYLEPCDFVLRGGSYTGHSYWSSTVATWPLVVLTVSSDRLTLCSSGLGGFHYDFPKNSVENLVLRTRNILPGVPVAGLQIIHNLPGIPPYIVFGTFCPAKLTSALKSLGFEYAVTRNASAQRGVGQTIKPYVTALGSIMAVILGLLFKFRILSFLKGDTILSGGREIPTEAFANFIARILFVGGGISFLIVLSWLIQRRMRRYRE